MSEEQRAQGDTLNKIAGDVSVIKRWWPVITLFCSAIGLTITLTIFLYKYDTNHATKADVSQLSNQIRDLSDKFSRHTEADSLDKINTLRETNGRIEENRTNVERLFKLLEKHGVVAYWTQKYSVSPAGARQIQNIPHHAYNR